MYAVVETGGKQYRVSEGDVIRVEKLAGEPGDEVVFDKVLAVIKRNGEVLIGSPYVEGAVVKGTLAAQGKGRKIRVFKYKSKVNYRKRYGHRQPYSEVKIQSIEI